MRRKAILMIHGFGGGTSDIEYLARYLEPRRKFDVYTFTLPGHQDRLKVKATKNDWINRCEDEIKWLLEQEYKSIYIIGHSMGAILACHLAKKYKQIKKIVLLAPAFQYLQFEGDQLKLLKSIQKSPEIIKDYPKAKVLSAFLTMPISTLSSFMDLVKECYEDPKYLDIPVLTIHGKKDKIAPMSSAEYVYNNLKSKINILVKMEDTDHGVMYGKRKDEVCILVNDFLKFNLHIRCQKTIDI